MSGKIYTVTVMPGKGYRVVLVGETPVDAASSVYADLGDAVALQSWLRERAAGYPPIPRLSFDPSVGNVTQVTKR